MRRSRRTTVSIPGVYGGLLDKVPFGAAFGRGITMKMGQTNMHNYMKPLLERIEKGQIDPSYIISHRISLEEAPEMYKGLARQETKRHQDRDRSLGGIKTLHGRPRSHLGTLLDR
jgi:threonine dehydrogenase-like Zn-dependent dehydrogenase